MRMNASRRFHTAGAIGIIVGTLGLVGTALAGTLNTPISTTVAPDVTYCSGVNVGTTPIASITVDLINNAGTINATNTCTIVAPDDDCFTTYNLSNSSRCRVTFTGPSKKIRGALTIVGSSGDKFVLPATVK
jgi:hypothetical protein